MGCFNDQAISLFHDIDFHLIPATGNGNQIRLAGKLAEFDFQQLVSFNAYFPCSAESELIERYPTLPRWGFCDILGNPVNTLTTTNASHMRDQYFQILGWEPKYSEKDRQVFLPGKTLETAEELFKKWSNSDGDRVYTLHLDSLPEKMWHVERWIALVDCIWSRWRAWPVLLGEESPDMSRLLHRFPFARNLPAQDGIVLHFASVKLSRAFIGIDSIFAHVSDSYLKPSVVLFGPSNPAVWGPVSQTSRLVRAEKSDQLHHLSLSNVEKEVDAMFGAIFRDS